MITQCRNLIIVKVKKKQLFYKIKVINLSDTRYLRKINIVLIYDK